ncbi:MAG: enoyl-CoA hydratase/isomerase family protein, partial [Chlamydiia bacterium]|nr:enoyl-CoA hydratase/isomerase family protein [Chlamydiia bacterium]
MMGNAFTLTVDQEGIGSLVFDLPGEKVNKFSPTVVHEFEQILDKLGKSNDLKALVISSAKPGIFIAGADINVIETLNSEDAALEAARTGHQVFNKLANLPFPTIALIDGACLGGGLEMALACDFRIVTDNPKTKLGLPEVNLGIIPGWGGTQRLPELIGLSQSLPMILAGKAIDSKKAWKTHLADALVSAEFKNEQARAYVVQWLTPEGRRQALERRKQCGMMNCLLERNPIGRKLIFKKAREGLMAKTGGHYPAPVAALDVIEGSHGRATDRGFKSEQTRFADLARSGISKNLIKVFFTSEDLKKEGNIARQATQRPIRSVAVLGGGVMGGGIAWLMSKGDIPVRIKDVNWDGVAKGFQQANSVYSKLVEIRKLQKFELRQKMHRITGTLDYTGFKKHDLIVEAIVE